MSTLSELVLETTTIKNNLSTCHSTLKAKLQEKGVEISDSDKITDLIKKIDDIQSGAVFS